MNNLLSSLHTMLFPFHYHVAFTKMLFKKKKHSYIQDATCEAYRPLSAVFENQCTCSNTTALHNSALSKM